jgi:hypothetical protein
MEAIEGSFVLESCFLTGCGRDTPDNVHKGNIGLAGGALKVALPLSLLVHASEIRVNAWRLRRAKPGGLALLAT